LATTTTVVATAAPDVTIRIKAVKDHNSPLTLIQTLTLQRLDQPAGIALSGPYAYVTRQAGVNDVSVCIVDAVGTFSSCIGSGGGYFSLPVGLIVSGNRIYAADSNLGAAIVKCSLNATTGLLNNDCKGTGSDFTTPLDVTVTNYGWAHIADWGGGSNIHVCTVSAIDESLTGCSTTGVSVAGYASIAYYGGSAYFTTSLGLTTNIIMVYTFSASTVAVSDCGFGAVNFADPKDIAFVNNGTAVVAYVTRFRSPRDVVWFQVGAVSGVITTCQSIGSGFRTPYPLAANPSIPVWVYVTNTNDKSISRCTLNTASGTLRDCTTINGPYAYISVTNTTSSTLYSCHYDATMSTFSGCTATGSGFNGNNDIVILGGWVGGWVVAGYEFCYSDMIATIMLGFRNSHGATKM